MEVRSPTADCEASKMHLLNNKGVSLPQRLQKEYLCNVGLAYKPQYNAFCTIYMHGLAWRTAAVDCIQDVKYADTCWEDDPLFSIFEACECSHSFRAGSTHRPLTQINADCHPCWKTHDHQLHNLYGGRRFQKGHEVFCIRLSPSFDVCQEKFVRLPQIVWGN